ncbi:hypothetical protein A2U01_0114969, partial [Trifolium medium]|nr:hypothetical protein [Trifolium medium]
PRVGFQTKAARRLVGEPPPRSLNLTLRAGY